MSVLDFFTILFILSLTWIVGRSVRLCIRMAHSDNRRKMFEHSFEAVCDGMCDAGISVVCVGAEEPDCVARLLSVEYERYEVIVVLDSVGKSLLLSELARIYSLVRVDYRSSEDNPSTAVVRGLYRSRRRRFRRLTVIDALYVSAASDVSAAEALAVYDYITVIQGDVELLPGAVERIVAEICSAEWPVLEMRSAAGAEVVVRMRSDILYERGCGSDGWRRNRRCGRISIFEPLAVRRNGDRRGGWILAAIVSAAFLAGWVLAVVSRDWLPVAAAVAMSISIVSAAIFCAHFYYLHFSGSKGVTYAMKNLCENLL